MNGGVGGGGGVDVVVVSPMVRWMCVLARAVGTLNLLVGVWAANVCRSVEDGVSVRGFSAKEFLQPTFLARNLGVSFVTPPRQQLSQKTTNTRFMYVYKYPRRKNTLVLAVLQLVPGVLEFNHLFITVSLFTLNDGLRGIPFSNFIERALVSIRLHRPFAVY